MARWIPTSVIAKTECIGRRIFTRGQLHGAADQKPLPPLKIELSHFMEKRYSGDVSMDRLGRTGIEKQVIGFLDPKACQAGSRMNPVAHFQGWVYITSRQFNSSTSGLPLVLVSSPAASAEDESVIDNPYHAHVERPSGLPPGHEAHIVALQLKHIFESNLNYQACLDRPVCKPGESA